MEFNLSPKAAEYSARLQQFMDEKVIPAEGVFHQQRADLIAAGKPHDLPAIVEVLKADAKAQGLWNLFLPHGQDPHHGLTVTDYATLAEITGWSVEIAPEAINCSAPDTGNMEVLDMFGTEAQKAVSYTHLTLPTKRIV